MCSAIHKVLQLDFTDMKDNMLIWKVTKDSQNWLSVVDRAVNLTWDLYTILKPPIMLYLQVTLVVDGN